MSDLILYVGNRNYSSWSLRAWLAVEQTGLPFREEMVWFDEDPERRQRLSVVPTGRVPALVHGSLAVWDSLAIAEYLAELAPRAGLWPEDRQARARARSLCAEMHSGFQALRQALPMNIRGRSASTDPGPEVGADVARVLAMWSETRREFGQSGPFLFGQRSVADAFYAPVATRFRTYAVPMQGEAAAYAESLLALPALRRWEEKAVVEGHPELHHDDILSPR